MMVARGRTGWVYPEELAEAFNAHCGVRGKADDGRGDGRGDGEAGGCADGCSIGATAGVVEATVARLSITGRQIKLHIELVTVHAPSLNRRTTIPRLYRRILPAHQPCTNPIQRLHYREHLNLYTHTALQNHLSNNHNSSNP